MDIKTATLVAILGISISLFAGAVVQLMQFGHAANASSLPTSYYLARLASVVAFLSLHVGLLVFLVGLYRRQ
ncbi:MAG: hypothetical protein NTZ78_04165 [Candidatus Aureabacteria bacterium]|nr:hypothetical protein [Candidatus Auribacterota bacterium]